MKRGHILDYVFSTVSSLHKAWILNGTNDEFLLDYFSLSCFAKRGQGEGTQAKIKTSPSNTPESLLDGTKSQSPNKGIKSRNSSFRGQFSEFQNLKSSAGEDLEKSTKSPLFCKSLFFSSFFNILNGGKIYITYNFVFYFFSVR